MRILKRHPLLKIGNHFLIDSPQPSNLSYWWNMGSLLGLSLVIQIITGVTLAMHYNASVLEAFNSVEHIMRDVNNGWLIRYLHANTASFFFFLVYLHIGRGLYYGSYKAPRTLTWTIGTVIFILMIVTAFLGYVLPYGQMSLWGATVITNLMSAIPWIGQDIVEFIWGGFSVNNATLNRFFSLHFVLPFILAALVMMHLIALHDSAGSSNPLGVSGNYDRLPFAPYFVFKDLITIFIFMWALSLFVFFVPNVLGDSENYVMANPMQTPPAIVPEWYLLPFYAILRSIPNKLIGVIAMLSAILIILAMTFTDLTKLRGVQFKPMNKTVFFFFVGILGFLLVLGAKHVESPYIELGQIGTLFYFAYFAVSVPAGSIFEMGFAESFLMAKTKLSKLSSFLNLNKNMSVFDYKLLEKTLILLILVLALWVFYMAYFDYCNGDSVEWCDSDRSSRDFIGSQNENPNPMPVVIANREPSPTPISGVIRRVFDVPYWFNPHAQSYHHLHTPDHIPHPTDPQASWVFKSPSEITRHHSQHMPAFLMRDVGGSEPIRIEPRVDHAIRFVRCQYKLDGQYVYYCWNCEQHGISVALNFENRNR